MPFWGASLKMDGSTTYHNMEVPMAMDLVCYVERTASALTNRQLSLLLGLEVPDGVVVLWVLQQLFGLHRAVSHDSYARHRMDCQLSSRMARLSLGNRPLQPQ